MAIFYPRSNISDTNLTFLLGSATEVRSNGVTTLPYSAQHPKQVESSLAATLCRARLQTRVAVFNVL